ncbi:type II secretion system major pseudopilin GspG [Pseudomonas indica]|uniref:type II secretion system major pseudopilin GspG n=1 Tax=Pseudomonas indica TaxID=137658 RepID=UPI000BAB5E0A|nr:type II secretion system major pseudopilin GspG [Pseudomonas indica]PAU55002.1 type II secretion system protein GspG [Pseudomonas indica]
MNLEPRPSSPCRRHTGFTLLEILVVLVILGLMASLVGPQVFKQLSGSKTKAAALQIQELSAALDLYRLELGSYPTTELGLEALITKPRNLDNWNGPYLKKSVIRKDPWGNDYQYRSPGEHGEFDLWSLGADNREGGDGENRDVHSWD